MKKIVKSMMEIIIILFHYVWHHHSFKMSFGLRDHIVISNSLKNAKLNVIFCKSFTALSVNWKTFVENFLLLSSRYENNFLIFLCTVENGFIDIDSCKVAWFLSNFATDSRVRYVFEDLKPLFKMNIKHLFLTYDRAAHHVCYCFFMEASDLLKSYCLTLA